MEVRRKDAKKGKSKPIKGWTSEQVDDIFGSWKGGAKPKVILTNDPSMTAWGWAVLDFEDNVLEKGCIKTAPLNKVLKIRKGDDNARRAVELVQQLYELVKKYDVRMLLVEMPTGSQNSQAAIAIGMVYMLIGSLSTIENIPVEWFTEAEAKKAVSPEKKIFSKDRMRELIMDLYSYEELHRDKIGNQAVADALAVHYAAKQYSEMLKLLTQIK